jgi:hypothetical protein
VRWDRLDTSSGDHPDSDADRLRRHRDADPPTPSSFDTADISVQRRCEFRRNPRREDGATGQGIKLISSIAASTRRLPNSAGELTTASRDVASNRPLADE